MEKVKLASLLLRIGLATVFAYAAISSFLMPDNWVGYFPQFLRHLVPQSILLTGFSVYESVLALWLLIGKQAFAAAILSTLTISGIIFTNIAQLDVIFRDFAIVFASLALAALNFKKYQS